jgi:hypothetical protein
MSSGSQFLFTSARVGTGAGAEPVSMIDSVKRKRYYALQQVTVQSSTGLTW